VVSVFRPRHAPEGADEQRSRQVRAPVPAHQG
jgi:hypothetical protein